MKRRVKTAVKERTLSEQYREITDERFWGFHEIVRPYTLASTANLYSLYQSTNYVIDNEIPGDFVECGVWRGGCSMMIALTLANRNVTDRAVWLFDTFEGMTAPTDNDVNLKGQNAASLLQEPPSTERGSVWCVAGIDDVRANMTLTGLASDQVHYVVGRVEDTLPNSTELQSLSILRLDTDWYESTKLELETLYPLLSVGGVVIVDDYGHWLGARKAVDEYFATLTFTPLLVRVDYTCHLAVKQTS